MKERKIIWILPSALLLGFCISPLALRAAGPELWVTWQAKNYAPSDFVGKKLPIVGSPVSAAVSLIDEGGRVADLSTTTIWWYLNNDPIGGGEGSQAIDFRPSDRGDQNLSVKVLSDGSQWIRKNISIPVVSPEAVIVSPFPKDKFSTSKIQLQAVPYFFNNRNPNELSLEWTVNNQSSNPAGDASILDVIFTQLPKNGSLFNVLLNIRNPRNILETASGNKTLQFEN